MRHKLNFKNYIEPKTLDSAELQEFARRTYDRSVQWFGQPVDAHIPYILTNDFNFNTCNLSFIFKKYILSIDGRYKAIEPKKASIAHEIYHRITMKKIGLRETYWLDEMMAFLVTDHILRIENYCQYADYRIDIYRSDRQILPIDKLKRLRRNRFINKHHIPKNFLSSISQIGLELELVVGWDALCLLINCKNWQEWFANISDEKRVTVKHILKM